MTIPVVTQGTYIVGPGAVTLDATIGEGNTGFISILLNGNEVATGNDGARADLGPGDLLRGSEVEVFARVSQMSPSPRSSLTYDWNGGPAPQTDIARGNFQVNGEPTPYHAIYRLA
jgi:hypothetical protein